MKAAGFEYTGQDGKVRCSKCKLQVSCETAKMNPLQIHAEMMPHCPFILSLSSNSEEENARKRRKNEGSFGKNNPLVFFGEKESMVELRRCTFTNWPQFLDFSSKEMINAGFFSCAKDDQVICIYCGLIRDDWSHSNDDPWAVHQRSSPQCFFVKNRQDSPMILPKASSFASVNWDDSCCHSEYRDDQSRYASFKHWPSENQPPIDHFVRAGFFYSGTKTIATCFYCNGSIENCARDDNLMEKHVDWFPFCDFAKQLKANSSQRTTGELTTASSERSNLLMPAEHTFPLLDRSVDAHMDLPISRDMMKFNISPEIIRSAWQGLLKIQNDKGDVTHRDLFIRCLIMQKQRSIGIARDQNMSGSYIE